MGKPYMLGERAATAIAQLCCHKKKLPQGAPTSPVISNMICAKLDGELRRMAQLHGCKYTRYADDLTFSTAKREFPRDLAATLGEGKVAIVGPALQQVIEANGFRANPEKTRLQSWHARQEVTGLIVNRRPNVHRAYVSQIRAMLHAWEKYGYVAAQQEYLKAYDTKHHPFEVSERVFERAVLGKLAFLKQVRGRDDNRYITLRRHFGRLMGEITAETEEGILMEFDVFICHASEDKIAVVQPLVKAFNDAEIRVWLDEHYIGWGDSITKEINRGLSKSKFVVLVLSESFMKKQWPEKEMFAVLHKEIVTGVTCALPLLVGNAATRKRILETYPMLAEKSHQEWSPSDIGSIVTVLKSMIQRAL